MRLAAEGFRAIWKETDSITKWIQVIALCVAAGWTFENFSVADKPSLEPNIGVFAKLSMDSGWESNTCRAIYDLTVSNEGKVSFDVDEIHFQGWQRETPKAAPGEVATFVNADDFSRGKQIVDETLRADNSIPPTSYLLRHYPPGQRTQENYTWILRASQPDITYFVVEVHAISDGKVATRYGRAFQVNACPASSTSVQEKGADARASAAANK